MILTDESGPAADRTASKMNTTDTTMVRPRCDIASAARQARTLERRASVALPVLLACVLAAGWLT